MMDWKRKRAPHCTACWDCYRCHRGCDGARPCGRCVALGRSMSCRDPDPDERLPRKRKKSNPSYDEEEDEPPSERKTFYVVDPHFPPAPPKPRRGSYPDNDARLLSSPSTSACTYSTTIDSISSARCYGTNEEAPLLAGLVHQVQRLYQATQSLRESQTIVREQIVALDTTKQTLRTPIAHIQQQSNLDRPTCTTTYITPHQQQQQQRQTQITKKYELPLSAQELMEEMLEEIISEDNRPTALALKSQSVKDATQFGESMFMPFVLQDSTKVPSLPFLEVPSCQRTLFESR